jgi:hypothetical protein
MKVATATSTAMSQGLALPYSPFAALSGIGRDHAQGRTVTVGTTDMPGPSSTSGR